MKKSKHFFSKQKERPILSVRKYWYFRLITASAGLDRTFPPEKHRRLTDTQVTYNPDNM